MAPKICEVYLVENAIPSYEKRRDSTNLYEKEYDYEEALDIIGFGKSQIAALLVCGLVLMAVICETMGMMIIVMASQCDLNTENYQKGLLSGISFFGILISSYFWGFIADRYGRRNVILYSTYVTAVFSFLSVLTNNFWIFLVMRLFCGISISGPSATIYAYLGEFNTMRNRQTIISWASTFVGFGTTFIPVIAWLILPHTWSFVLYDGVTFRPWKLTLMIYSLPALLGATLMIWMPESPKFLLSQNREREAYPILEWIYVKNTGKPPHTLIVQKLKTEGDKDYLECLHQCQGLCNMIRSVWNQTVPLLRRPHAGNLLICCVCQFGIFFASSGLGLWFPEIINRFNSMKDESPMTVCNVINLIESQKALVNETMIKVCDDSILPKVFLDSTTMGLSFVVGYTILALIINSIGRIILLPAILLLSGLCGLALLWMEEPTFVVLFFCGLVMLSGLCVSVVNGACVDLIPTHLRGMAVCLQLSMGRLGSIAGSNIVGWLLYENCYVTFSFFSGFVILCGILSILLPKKPKSV